MKGDSAIWNVLMSAAGASFVIVAVALVIVASRSGEQTADDTSDAAAIASAHTDPPDAGSIEVARAEVSAIQSATAVVAPAAASATAQTDASAVAEVDAAGATDDLQGAGGSANDKPSSAAAAATSAQSPPPIKAAPTKPKPTKKKTKRH